jgi:hypothetical protein
MSDLSKKEEEINSLLDARNEHTQHINAIDAKMADIVINHSDAENWEEIHNYQQLMTPSATNPLIKQRLLEESIVHAVDEKLSKKQ